MDAELTPGSAFLQLAARARGMDAELKRTFTRAVKDATAPAEGAAKRAILGIRSKGTAGGGRGQRSEHAASRSRTGKTPLPSSTGLRKNVAKGVTRKITYSGYRIGVRIRVDGKYLPASQQTLIKKMNSGKKFRHPVMGNRNVWVDQVFTPPEAFDKAMREHGKQAVAKIEAAASATLRKLQ